MRQSTLQIPDLNRQSSPLHSFKRVNVKLIFNNIVFSSKSFSNWVTMNPPLRTRYNTFPLLQEVPHVFFQLKKKNRMTQKHVSSYIFSHGSCLCRLHACLLCISCTSFCQSGVSPLRVWSPPSLGPSDSVESITKRKAQLIQKYYWAS